tara:strand:- start:132 stop:452 length:321 start_codon:yes stop_codon:yes gene_type:complete
MMTIVSINIIFVLFKKTDLLFFLKNKNKKRIMRATITKYPIEIKMDTDFEGESDSNFNFKEFSMASFSESTISPLEIILTPDRTIPLERLIWDKLKSSRSKVLFSS